MSGLSVLSEESIRSLLTDLECASDQIERLQRQNAELLAALDAIKHSVVQSRIPGNDWRRELALIENTVDAARAAIASAEGGA